MARAFNAVYANLEASIARTDDFSNEGVPETYFPLTETPHFSIEK